MVLDIAQQVKPGIRLHPGVFAALQVAVDSFTANHFTSKFVIIFLYLYAVLNGC